ncbi:MAG: hypothetical protein EZS28_048590, partial [Streblomastix strix]
MLAIARLIRIRAFGAAFQAAINLLNTTIQSSATFATKIAVALITPLSLNTRNSAGNSQQGNKLANLFNSDNIDEKVAGGQLIPLKDLENAMNSPDKNIGYTSSGQQEQGSYSTQIPKMKITFNKGIAGNVKNQLSASSSQKDINISKQQVGSITTKIPKKQYGLRRGQTFRDNPSQPMEQVTKRYNDIFGDNE